MFFLVYGFPVSDGWRTREGWRERLLQYSRQCLVAATELVKEAQDSCSAGSVRACAVLCKDKKLKTEKWPSSPCVINRNVKLLLYQKTQPLWRL